MSNLLSSNLINRRYFFFGSLSIALGCSRTRASHHQHPVSIVRANSYAVDLEKLVREILVEHQVAIKGRSVLLKPNLVEFSSESPINTNPTFVAAVANAFSALGASKIHIAEGPGHRRATLDMASTAGYFSAVNNFEKNFTDLNLDDVKKVRLARPFSTLSSLYLPQTVFKYDLLVSLPKMKTHHWTGATLSMKNLFGVVPGAIYGWPKNVLHWAGIHECVADLHCLLPEQFSLVDGIEAMEGNGPILGTSIAAGLIVAGASAPAVDETCCRLMGLDPLKIRYLQLTKQRPTEKGSEIVQIAEPLQANCKKFKLLPELQHLSLS